MAPSVQSRTERPPTAQGGWSALLRLAAITAAVSAVFLPVQVGVFLAWPPPLDEGAAEWFTLLHDNRIAGLIDLDILLVADNVLLLPILLALFVRLRQVRESTMLFATALGLLGIIAYVVTNPAIQMAALGDDYARAATDAERASAVAAGQAVLATWQGTAFHVGYLAGSVAGVMIGAVMLGSPAFGKVTASMMIMANAVGLGLYIPTVGVYVAVFSVLFLEIWYVLMARALWRLHSRPTA